MDILALKVVVTDTELTEVARGELRTSKAPVKDLIIRFTSQGIEVKGSYQMMMSVPFETSWRTAVEGGKLVVALNELKVSGFPAGMMKGMLLQTIAANVPVREALTTREDALVLDLDRLLSQNGLQARTNLRTVHCEDGKMTIEAGSPEA
jgi:hypothetical protein